MSAPRTIPAPLALADLIATLQVAPEGSRELDAHVAATLHLAPPDAEDWVKNWTGRYEARDYGPSYGWYVVMLFANPAMDGHGGHFKPPPFSGSLDAALTLVPEGWYGRVEPRFWYEPKPHVLWSGFAIRPNWDRWNPVNLDWFDNVEAPNAHTPALALCIASLRARASQGETS